MPRSFLKKILSIVVSLFIMVIIVPITRVEADYNNKTIIIDGSSYVLGKSTLPAGLSWNADEQVLTMADFHGGYIHEAVLSGNSEEPFKIKIVGSNSLFNTLNKEALSFGQLKIFGNDKSVDKLVIDLVSNRSRAIESNYAFELSKVNLQIKASLSNTRNSLIGIYTTYKMIEVKDAILSIDLSKSIVSEKDVHGIFGGLNLSEGSSANIIISNMDAANHTSIAYTNSVIIKGSYYVEANYEAGQGGQTNPYVMSKVKVRADKKVLNKTDIHISTQTNYTGVELFEESKLDTPVETINLSDSIEGTTFYVKMFTTGSDAITDWYKVTVFREGTFYDLEVIGGNGSGSYKEGAVVPLGILTPPAGYRFDEWTSEDGVVFENARASSTTMTMPGKKVTVKANLVKEQSIKVNGNVYVLGINTLPNGLSWDVTDEVLTMNGYHGSDIQDSRDDIANSIRIKVIGENTITARDGQDALRFKKIMIEGNNKENDKLTISTEGHNSRAIFSPSGFEISKVDLRINANLWHSSGLKGIHTIYEKIEVKDAILSIDLSESLVSDEDVHGIFGSLHLSGDASANFMIRNTKASGHTSVAYNNSPIINGAYYVEANYKAEQGSKDNPYEMSKVKIRAEKDKIGKSDIVTPFESAYDEVQLFAESNLENSVGTINLSNSTSGTTFYVRMYEKGNSSNSAWFKVTAIKEEQRFNVVVNNGTGSDSYKSGDEVQISADAAPEGYKFDKWISTDGIDFADANAETTSFVMPNKDVAVEATFIKLPDQPTFTYDVLSGDKTIWEKGSSEGITIKIDGDINKFKSLEVDGKIVDGANYEVNAGSTVIILSPSYLEGLLAGNYEMTAKFDGVEVAATFSIKDKAEEEPEEEPKEEKPEVKPDEEKPKEEKPEPEEPGDKLPGMGDNTRPLALFLIVLGGLLFTKSKTEE